MVGRCVPYYDAYVLLQHFRGNLLNVARFKQTTNFILLSATVSVYELKGGKVPIRKGCEG